MTPELLKYLCEPITKAPLQLVDAVRNDDGTIESGVLLTDTGNRYQIIKGIPRFVDYVPKTSVDSFGDEWNYFNFTEFKTNWLSHTIANTFGTTDVFKGKLIVDAGGGSGSQTKWFVEYGASHVIMLELSHSVDDVVLRNLVGLKNVDVVQCSIDAPPLLDQSVNGIVYCHNVIQHTPSVEKTANALFKLVANGGEFVFNCYPLNDNGIIRWIRFHLIYKPIRAVLSHMPFYIILFYARVMSFFRLIPVFGFLFEKFCFCIQGDVQYLKNDNWVVRLKKRFQSTSLNTFDAYGSHQYQHHKSNDELRSLVDSLQPDSSKVLNIEKYFSRPAPIGCAMRLFK